MSETGHSEAPKSPGPGWYPDTAGTLRWWDGHAWGPAAPSNQEGLTWATLCHLSWMLLPLVLPIVLRVVAGRQGRFTRHHTNEALNAQIRFAIIWNASIVTLIVATNGAEAPSWIGVPITIVILDGLALLVFGILAAVRASQGRYWRYPLPFRFTPGSVRGQADA